MLGGVFAQSCSMPCCKAKIPNPNCPMVKAATVRDVISPSTFTFDNARQVLHVSGSILFAFYQTIATRVNATTEIIALLFAGPPASVRAPPADIHLENA